MKKLILILSILLFAERLFAQDTIRPIQFPIVTVYGEVPQSIHLDTIKLNRSDWEIPGITIRSMGTNMPVRVGILGAPPGGTILKVDGISWNDPRTGLADLSELPDWPIERLNVVPGTVSGAQGGMIAVNLLSPAKWSGWNLNLTGDSDKNYSGEMLWSGGETVPVGLSVHHQWHKRDNSFPTIWDRRRDLFAGNDATNVYLTLSPKVSQEYTLRTSISYHNDKNDLPGLVGRTVESGTNETKNGIDATFRFDAPFSVQTRIGEDQTHFVTPQWQTSPTGLTPFFPIDEKTGWRGAAVSVQHHDKIGWLDELREEVNAALDWVRLEEIYHTTNSSISTITQRNTLTGTLSTTKTFRTVRFLPWFGGRFQADRGEWRPSNRSLVRYSSELSGGFSPFTNVSGIVRLGDALRWPSLTEMFLAPNIFVAGNPNLDPEHSQEIQGEVKWTPVSTVGISGLIYARDTRNGIVWRQNSRGQYVPRNLLHSISNGGAGKLSFHPNESIGFTFSGARTYTWNATSNEINYGKRLPLIPLYQLDASFDANTKWKSTEPYFSARWFYQSRRFLLESNTDPLTTENNDLPDEAVVDCTAGIRCPIGVYRKRSELDFELSARNIFNRHRWAIEGIPLPDRTIVLSMIWKKGVEQ